MTSPCAIAICTRMTGLRDGRAEPITRSSESWTSSAARTAPAGWGNMAIRPSPSVLITRPPWPSMMRATTATLWVTTVAASALPRLSYREVLPRRSAKRMVQVTVCDMASVYPGIP